MNLINLMKKFSRLLGRQQTKRLIEILLITIVGTFFEILGVSLMVPMVTAIVQPDIIANNRLIARVCEIFDIHSHKTFVILCIIALIAVYIIKNLFLVFEGYAQARFTFNNKYRTKSKIFHSIINKPYEFFISTSSSEILNMINTDVERTYNLMLTCIHFISELIVSLGVLIAIFVIDPVMTAIILGLLIVILLLINKVVKPILVEKGAEYRKYTSVAYKWLLQAVEGIKEIKIADKCGFFENNFYEAGKKQDVASGWDSFLQTIPRNLIELSCVSATLSVIALMIYNGRPLETLIPTLGAFAMAAVKLMPASVRIENMLNVVSYNGPCIDNVMNILFGDQDGQTSIDDIASGEDTRSFEKLQVKEMIRLCKITYAYPNNNSNVLEKADMEIPVGTAVGIIGKSGAGKTTSVDILLGLLHPSEGGVYADGVDIRQNYRGWLADIGYIPQTLFMLDDSIRANVVFGNEPDDEKVMLALKQAHLDEFVNGLPDGLDTFIGERGIRLSGGQRQRIGIARALYNDPDILVFDEATSSLDNETEKEIMNAVNRLHGKKTMIIIAHRLQTIENCDIVYKVENGSISRVR